MSFQNLLDLTQQKFSKLRPESEIDFNLASDEKPPTGLIVNNPLLEYVLDRRFLAYGRFYLGYGKKSSGKTSMFYEFAKIFQKNGGDVVWLETENAADLDYAAKQGVDLSRLVIQHPKTLEEGLQLGELYVRNMPKAYPDGDTPVLICFDSIGVGTEYEVSDSNGIMNVQPGLHARVLSRWYRETTDPLSKEKCVFLVLNQLKQKIGAFGFGEDVSDSLLGGEQQFFSSTYHWKFKKISELTDEDPNSKAERKVGSRHKIECKRNKLGREGKGQDIEYDSYIDGGIDWWSPLVRKLGKDYTNIVNKEGAGYYKWKIENTVYFTKNEDGEQSEAIIDTAKNLREHDLAIILSNSPQACDIIRSQFGIPDLPTEKEVEEVEKDRKTKRKKKPTKLDE